MPSAAPKRDVSHTWPVCRRPGCGARHLSTYDCPPRGRWLVARFCPACNGSTYCDRHSAREFGRPVVTVVRSQRTNTNGPRPALARTGTGRS